MKFKNILVPYDGSKYSERAFKTALDLAKKSDSKITVLECFGDYSTGAWFIDNRIFEKEFKKQSSIAKKTFKKFASMAEKDQVYVQSKILKTTQIPKAIVSFANKSKIDLIVMGSHGRSGLDKLLLGSVTNGVSQKSKCSVLIVK